MSAEVSRQSVSGAAVWAILDFVIERGANFAIIVVLVRLLSPEEFGIVALLAVFIALASLLSESGLGQALIQSGKLEDGDTSTAFWINVGLAALVVLALLAAGPFIAHFFDQPVLVPLMQILALGVAIGAFGTVQRALLLRALAYRKLLIVRVSATAISGLIAIALALAGYGVFALAFQAVALALVTTVLLWLVGNWRPRAVFRKSSARRLLGFGGYMLASSVLETVYSRAYTLFIGKIGSPAMVGLYGRADATLSLVQGLVAHPLNQLAFPTLSRIAEDRERLGAGVRDGLKVSMLANVSVLAGLAVLAEPFIRLVYGAQWVGAVPFIQILSLGAMLMPIHILNLHALMALGRSDLFFWLEVAKKSVGVGLLVIGSYWGPIGIAWGAVAAGFMSALINTSLSGRLFEYGLLAQLRDIMPSVLLALLVAGGTWLVTHFDPIAALGDFGRLGIGAAVGAAIWIGVAFGLNLSDVRGVFASLKSRLAQREATPSPPAAGL